MPIEVNTIGSINSVIQDISRFWDFRKLSMQFSPCSGDKDPCIHCDDDDDNDNDEDDDDDDDDDDDNNDFPVSQKRTNFLGCARAT